MIGIVITVVVIISGIIWFMYQCDKAEKINAPRVQAAKEDTIKNLRDLNIQDNILVWMDFYSDEGCLIYTKENRLFNIFKKGIDFKYEFKEIKINDILDFNIDAKVKEKNKMKIISIVPTFNSYKSITGINVTLTTTEEVLKFSINNSSLFKVQSIGIKPKYEWNDWKSRIDELNRLKLLIERQMNTNN